MKKIIVLSIISVFFCNMALSQEADCSGPQFTKRVEYNIRVPGVPVGDNLYNIENKSTLERVLFGERNSFVEFVFRGFVLKSDEIFAFRIIKNTTVDSFKIEIMRMPDINYVRHNIEMELAMEENQILIPYKILQSMSPEIREMINEHNKKTHRYKMLDELHKPYRPKSETYAISKEFAEKLHGKMATLIDVFQSDSMPSNIFDGDEATFRCVVGNELRTLIVYNPQRRALKLSEICVQIIKDSDKDEIDESKYIELLDEIKM